MNRVFYIFRHGETDWNKEGRCQGHSDIELNKNGLNQAGLLAEKLFQFPLEIVVSSDLLRAQKTGSIVASKKKIPIIIDDRLKEMNYGQAEGMLYHQAIGLFGEELWQKYQTFSLENDDICFTGGETRKTTRDRFHSALMDLINHSNYKTFGISTHGGALRNFLHSFLPENFEKLPIPNCVVYKCEYFYQKNEFQVNPNPL